MNGIIALCHFCEVHGPSILFCTQAFHSQQPLLGSCQSLTDDDLTDQYTSSSFSGLQRSLSTGSANQLQQSTETATGELTSAESEPSMRNTTKSTEYCEACRSFQAGHPGFISNDTESKVSYISDQKPHHPQVFTMVRQACVRSLSCEVCPGREGPMFFGDDHRGHVFSHTFFLKDTQARGFQRWYSIIVVMMDKIFLLNSWPFLVKHFRNVIDDLQEKATALYEEEQSKCPVKQHRLTHTMTPTNFRQQRGPGKQARSLPEITSDKKIFRKLHLAFTSILKAGGNRLTEKLLEGPPTEDSVIDMEKHEETEEGFVLLYSTKDNTTEEEASQQEVDQSILHSHPEDCLEEVEGENEPTFNSLRHLLKVLGTYKFHELAHHVIIGNQVVIRSYLKTTVMSIIDVLKLLLPKGCGRIIYYSSRYEDSWRCNFLGLTPGVTLPSHIDLYVTLDVLEPEKKKDASFLGESPCLKFNQEGAEFMGYTFIIQSPQALPEKGPSVLSKMELALLNDKLADTVVEQCLICLKEEWMNKVKVLFKFTKAGGNRTEDDTRKLLQVVGAQSEDKAVLKFWMTGLSVQYRNHMLSSAINQNM